MADDNKNQHIVPQFHQKFFETTSDHKIFVREKGKPTTDQPKPIKRQTSEDDAYTVTENGKRDLSGDKLHGHVERTTSPKLAAIEAETCPDKEQWHYLLLYMANQLARSRRTREVIKDGMGMAALVGEEIAPVVKAAEPMPAALSEMFGMKNESIDDWIADLWKARERAYRAISNLGTEAIAKDLCGMQANLLIAPTGTNFILSDDPVLVYLNGKPVLMEMKPDFLIQPGIEVFMALKPNIACLFSPKYGTTFKTIAVTKEEVEKYNNDLWGSCYKCVLGRRKADLDALNDAPKISEDS